ncbi:hypothetical protein AGMMS50249_5320 [candidate division SR1 bacterium]|nr:hypothetical protein AGMMS50249_5320 [candidate division SR1 bacterium]
MDENQTKQLFTILSNIEESRKFIPTFSDLAQHPVFGIHFSQMKAEEKSEVNNLINTYITDRVHSFHKTKGGQLFIRFFESLPELFWRFRQLNENTDTASSAEFQTVGKQVESELFRLEGILTDKMINQEKGLDKVVESFYNIVYTFFPRFNMID